MIAMTASPLAVVAIATPACVTADGSTDVSTDRSTDDEENDRGVNPLELLGGCSFSCDRRTGLAKWLPWTKSNGQSQIKQSILGTASGAGSSKVKSSMAVLCPWFDAHSRQKQEFVTEMRLLSRLRHPCITTVMGAVISAFVRCYDYLFLYRTCMCHLSHPHPLLIVPHFSLSRCSSWNIWSMEVCMIS